MKLTAFLRKILPLMMVATVTLGTTSAWAGVMHTGVSQATYTDFGQNKGRYTTTANALLDHLRQRDGGIVLTYANGQKEQVAISYEQGMISYASQTDNGAAAAVGYSYLGTVEHNGEIDATFGGRHIGEDQMVRYSAIEYRSSDTFRNVPNTDYKVTRLSKVVTDVQTSSVYTGEVTSLSGTLAYRAGAGDMYIRDAEGNQPEVMGAYNYIIGGINNIDSAWYNGSAQESYSIHWNVDYTDSGLGESPLPNALGAGDSGSPIWVYNDKTGQYEYFAASQSGNVRTDSYARGAGQFTQDVMDDDVVAVKSNASTLYLDAVTTQGSSTTDSQGITATQWIGTVTDGSNTVASYNGVQSGINTWNDLSDLKDTDNWYNYGEDFLNAVWNNVSDAKKLNFGDLFLTNHLQFKSGQSHTTIVLNDTVDLGVGYARFSGTGNTYVIQSAAGENNQFNHAGYVVDAGVHVHLQLSGDANHMYEWRKVGAGHLYIEGRGNNNVLLNLGGSGKTILNRTGGYAAYNVLANSGTTVVLEGGAGQIARDFTFGLGGARLDFAGHDWTEGEDFTIHALTEEAVLMNEKAGTTASLEFNQGGTFLGSFRDTADAALQVHYKGQAGSTWTLHSIFTNLQNEQSGLFVDSGKVLLEGTNTVHAMGSMASDSTNRYTNDLDWHYADAAMDVTVAGGATFELGSHARLTGDVTVADQGVFIMREGVQHEKEYIEGGYELESTAAISAFYGLKGDVNLQAGGSMKVQYSQGVTANNTYARNISGAGSLEIDLGSKEARFTLAGDNSEHTGTKTLTSGVLVAKDVAALGDTLTNKWKLGAATTLQVESGLTAANAPGLIDASSTGTLALTEDMAVTMNMSGHEDLFVGAAAGKTVQYGVRDEDSEKNTLSSVKNKWNLGGGGGELVVNAKLNDKDSTLVLGNGQGLGGIVQLTNTANNIGSITFSEGVTLTYDDTLALGGASIELAYGSAVQTSADTAGLLALVSQTSAGAILLDKAGNAAIDMTVRPGLSLHSLGDATYSGTISVGKNGTYRFGGSEGTLTVNAALAAAGTNDMVVDGQGHSCGKLILGAATAISGHVTVQGHKDGGSGDMTLGFGVDNALASVSGVTVKDGGILDVGSTTQTLTNLVVQTGGLLKGNADGTLVFNMTSTGVEQTGSMQLGKVEKTGIGELVLASTDNSWDLFTVKQGTLSTRVDNALSATGITRVENGATLSMDASSANRTMHGNVVLGQGGQMVTVGNNRVIINGTISVDAGATGTLGAGSWELNSLENNEDGGTLALEGGHLYFNQTAAQHVGGTLDIAADKVTFHSIEDNGADNMLKHLDAVNVASGKELVIQDHTWNTIWQLDKLTGEGAVNWNSSTTHSKSARLVIGGEGRFTGEINVNRACSDWWFSRTYQALLQIDSEEAVSGATINLSGAAGDDSHISLALNAERVKLGGLNGNEYSHVLAGAAPDASPTSVPGSTANATMVITGSGTYTHKGSIGTAADTAANSVSIEMAGAGTQNLTGSSIYVNKATAMSGTLNITSSGFHALSGVGVAQGANLKVNDSFTLDAGKTLSVLATSGSAASANFNSALVLNGGTLSFDGQAMINTKDSGGALNLASGFSVSNGASIVIDFTNTSALKGTFNYLNVQKAGETYTLANGDWTGLLGQISASGLEYYDATFTAADGSLQVTMTVKEGFLVWDGGISPGYGTKKADWGSKDFGLSRYEDANDYFASTVAGKSVVFDDSAAITEVHLTNSGAPDKAVFNASKDYRVWRNENTNYTQTVNELVQQGTGTTTLEAGTVVVKETARIDQGTLVVQDTATLEQSTVSGEGKLVLDWASETEGSLKVNRLNALEQRGGTLKLNADAKVAEMALDNAAEVHVGSAADRIEAFSSKVTDVAGEGAALHLYTREYNNNTDYNWRDNTVSLEKGSTLGDVYVHGDLALNLWKNGSSYKTLGDKVTNLQDADVHMDAGSSIVVRDNSQAGLTPTTGRILLNGNTDLVAYSHVSDSTVVTSDIARDAAAAGTAQLTKKDTGSVSLSGNVALDAIAVQAGRLKLAGERIDVATLDVQGGTLHVAGETRKLAVSTLKVAEHGTMEMVTTVMVKDENDEDVQKVSDAELTVNSLAEFAQGATVKAHMVLATGATLDLGGTITLEGALKLQTGLTLSGSLLEEVQGLTEGGSVALFTGVTTLSVQVSPVATLADMRTLAEQTRELLAYNELMSGSQVSAAEFFENLAGYENLVLTYDSSTGTVSIKDDTKTIPEPATATLSLLALAALCARRRRK